MYILRAGITGCLAAMKWPNAKILDPDDGPNISHHALLRMRTNEIEYLTGIPFKEVRVRKFIWDPSLGRCRNELLLQDITNYARKTTGIITNRSITNLETERRFIPPNNFHERLLELVGDRIIFEQCVRSIYDDAIHTNTSSFNNKNPIISTLPMEENLSATAIRHDINFDIMSRPIFVNRLLVDNYDLDATVYFPAQNTSVYRASMLGKLLVIESINSLSQDEMEMVQDVFGIKSYDSAKLMVRDAIQRNGKIVPVPDEVRKDLLHKMTLRKNLYSLGRFACWRQILLDDVIQDMKQIERMMKTNAYDRSLA